MKYLVNTKFESEINGVYWQMVEHERPEVVCMCGSTRFTNQMLFLKWEMEKQGIIVMTWNYLPTGYVEEMGHAQTSHLAEQEGVKEALDELHKRKIDMSDRVFVINIDGYIGESTKSEIDYAEATGKPVTYLEPLEG